MYITEITSKSARGKEYHTVLLRGSYRAGGQVKNHTLANLSHCKPEEIAAIRLALKHKADLSVLGTMRESVELQEGPSVGAAWTVYAVARRLGIASAFGSGREGKLALWQVMARVLDQGSRLSAVRLAQHTAATDILGLRQGFDENDLYDNLAWLADAQKAIERKLFRARCPGVKAELFLYDVTSSYFEGSHNVLAAWGYNRDKKNGKKQVVVGLLCDAQGDPVAVEVFTGNTSDPATLASAVRRAAQDFGCQRVTWVGDRGMIKSAQIADLHEKKFYYITAITKPQIETLLKAGSLQMSLFDEKVCEVAVDGVRYVLRRNPQRADEMARTRQGKQASLEKWLHAKNSYLAAHARAQVAVAVKHLQARMARLKVEGWLKAAVEGRRLHLQVEAEALAQSSRLDGCYVIKTDLPQAAADAQTVHDRYKDLAHVEQAFRTCKTALLEMRPWFVRIEKSTRGHALVVMLAYLIVRHLSKAWAALDLTVEEGLRQLSTLCTIRMTVKGGAACHCLPTPRPASAELLRAAEIELPKSLPFLGARVVTRKKLQEQRVTH